MKTSVISEEFPRRYLSNPDDPNAFEGKAAVFDGPEDYHARIDDPARDRRGHDPRHARAGPRRLSGRGGGGEHAAAGLPDQEGRQPLPCIGDGRQSGTSGSPSILNASPEAAVGGGLALLKTGAGCSRRNSGQAASGRAADSDLPSLSNR
jgi:dihydroxy-acid dehydratase